MSKRTRLGSAQILLALSLAEIGSAQQGPAQRPQPTAETLVIGTTTLRLGMSKQSVLSALETQYDVLAVDANDADASVGGKPNGRNYLIMSANSDLVGSVDFNSQGNLVAVGKNWTPGKRPYSEEEIFRALINLIGNLASEGNSTCLIVSTRKTDSNPKSQAPRSVSRDAALECGTKRIDIGVLTYQDGTAAIDIDERLGKREDAFR